jgi:hypothetical protein
MLNYLPIIAKYPRRIERIDSMHSVTIIDSAVNGLFNAPIVCHRLANKYTRGGPDFTPDFFAIPHLLKSFFK